MEFAKESFIQRKLREIGILKTQIANAELALAALRADRIGDYSHAHLVWEDVTLLFTHPKPAEIRIREATVRKLEMQVPGARATP